MFTTLLGILQRKNRPRNFSPDAVTALLTRQAEYIEEIGAEAIRTAQRAKADVVSASDVETADRRVRASTQRRRIWEVFGGLAAGAGASEILNALSESPITENHVLLGLVPFTIGLVVLVFTFSRGG